MSPAIMAAAIRPSALTATPARHSLRPFSLPKPTLEPAGASVLKRSEEMRRTDLSLAILSAIFCTPRFSSSVSGSSFSWKPEASVAATRASLNSS